MSSFIELPNDSEEVAERYLSDDEKKEIEQTERIDNFLKEVAGIDACPVQPLQTENKFLRDALVENMKKSAEKEKSCDIGYPVKTVKKREEITVEKISDNVFAHPVRAVEINIDRTHATREEALSEGSIEKDDIFARLDKDKRLPRVVKEGCHVHLVDGEETSIDTQHVSETIVEESGMKPMNSEHTKHVATPVSAEEEKIRLKDELRREYLRDRVRDTKIIPRDAQTNIDKRAELQVKKDMVSRGEKIVPQSVEIPSFVDKEVVDNKREEKILAEKELDIAVFGSYKIKRQIDSGSHGVLYEGVAEITGRKVVLKTENEENGASLEERAKNSIGEATINNEVNHDNIMPIENVVKDAEGRVYLVMPFIKGAKKAELADKRTQKEIAEVGKHLADALSAVHKKGIIHRDVKPENTLIDTKGKPILLDFGIAKVDEKINPDLANSLTGTRFIDDKTAGSIRYMAPEVLEGWEKASEQSDIYSLGKMLYRMAMQSEEALPIGDVKQQLKDKGIEEKLADCITKSVADKTHRYKTAEELANDLTRILEVKVPEEDILDFEGAVKLAKEFDATQKLEEKVDATVKNDGKTMYDSYTTRIYRGKGLSLNERLMKTAEYLVYLNNVLLAFGSELRITDVSPVELNQGINHQGTYLGTKTKEMSLVDFIRYGCELGHISWKQLSNDPWITINFASFNGRIKGYVGFGKSEKQVEITIIPYRVTVDNFDLLKVIKYFAIQQPKYNTGYSYGKEAVWGSPKERLEGKGFTLDFALYVLEKKIEPPSGAKIFVIDKPLYTVDNKRVGKLNEVKSSDVHFPNWVLPSKMHDSWVTHVNFYHGRWRKGKTEYARHEFIDIGDCFVLMPNAELP
ncbi:protein kinase [Candidatus Woesearchaeota archaeon]|nr:protein kinase [Candidatus Woesearchaeota archaeon]